MKCKNCGRGIRLRNNNDHWPANGFQSDRFNGMENPRYRHTNAPKVSCDYTDTLTIEIDESSAVVEILERYEV